MKRRYVTPPRHEPSEAEIREACERIQAGWRKQELGKRKAAEPPVETPMVSLPRMLAEKHA